MHFSLNYFPNQVTFDPFIGHKSLAWRAQMDSFNAEVRRIENEAKNFIDESFKKLRSAEGAFEMLLNFKHIKSREVINDQMMMKFNDILLQYGKEVERMDEIFSAYQDAPPLHKNHPPMAGSIFWCRSLFFRIKHTIITFQAMDDMIKSEQALEARSNYLLVGRKMRDYEETKFSQWQEEVEALLPGLLKRNLLIGQDEMLAVDNEVDGAVHNKNVEYDVPGDHGQVKFVVNFVQELKRIIIEAKYMETIGFPVPELARNVALQEEKYISAVDGLNLMLGRYHKILGSLEEAELDLLQDHIEELRRVIRPGSKRLNWNSLGISDFIGKCQQAIAKFESLVNQIQKNAKDINLRLQMIEETDLFKYPPPKFGTILPSAKEFFEHIEKERAKDFEVLAQRYRAIGPLLTKMEGLVVLTNTGKSPKMKSYYSYWEARVFKTLTRLVNRNLKSFNKDIVSDHQLFQVETLLAAPDIVLHPPANELNKLFLQNLRDCVEGTRVFTRWMAGTCLETPPQKVDGEDNLVNFTYFSDIAQNSDTKNYFSIAQTNFQKKLSSMTQYLSRWKKYRKVWKVDKSAVLDKWFAKNPTVVMFDDQLHYYTLMIEEIQTMPLTKNQEMIRLHMAPLVDSIKDHAKGWIKILGKLLNESASTNLYSLKSEIDGKREDLAKTPDTLGELKFVLKSIADIREISLTVEFRCLDIQERYRVLSMFNLGVTEEEEELQKQIMDLWQKLFYDSKLIDASLLNVKKKFAAITLQQIREFGEELIQFYNRFVSEGPGAIAQDLERGMDQMKSYKNELTKYENIQKDLADAEKLFDLPITLYPELLQVQKEMNGLTQIFALYEEQTKARAEWAETLWANLDIQHLQDGIEAFLKRLRGFPHEIKSLSSAMVLEEKMQEFKSSIPLFLDLKNKALRERHWRELMEKTGHDFDMNPGNLAGLQWLFVC